MLKNLLVYFGRFVGFLGRCCFFNLALKGALPSPVMPWIIIIVNGLKCPRIKKRIAEMMSWLKKCYIGRFFGLLGRFCFFNLGLKGALPYPGMPWHIIIVIGTKCPRIEKIVAEMMS